MTLEQLLSGIDVVSVQGDVGREVGAITRDSRQVQGGDVFVAIEGARVDGHDLVPTIEGAAAVIVQRAVQAPAGVTTVQVEDSKQALALLAAARHGHPSSDVRVVGITGTNGKTTVSTLVEGALLRLGRRVARMGTTGNAVNGVVRPSAFTTPEAPQLQAFLAELRDADVPTLVMEVSSIGLAQRRVDGIRFHTAAFTNLTQDHLDFHGDMDSYRDAKRRLFTELLRPAGGQRRALLFGDDPAWVEMGAPEDAWTYGFGAHNHIHIVAARVEAGGTGMELRTPRGQIRLHSPMIGRHNACNLACALGLLMQLGEDMVDAAMALSVVEGVPGRLEVVKDPRAQRLVVVDYAHTPDALAHALNTMREVTGGRLHVVFGCGGDRDAGKRPQMGAVAEEMADALWVTSDNPRSEPPRTIIGEIAAGLHHPERATLEPDRRQAIQLAVRALKPGDSLLIAGKGHETYQEIAGQRAPFDDRVEAAAALEG